MLVFSKAIIAVDCGMFRLRYAIFLYFVFSVRIYDKTAVVTGNDS